MSYSARTIEHFHKPRNVGTLDEPRTVGQHGIPGQGNFMTIHLRVERGAIADVRYQTYGCPGAIACGSVLTEMVKGISVREALAITPEQLNAELGGLPLGKGHCAELAVSALRDALANLSRPGTAEVSGSRGREQQA